jgi:hypothetical protein
MTTSLEAPASISAPSRGDRLARTLVWLVFALMLANGGRFIATYASRVMIQDDISIAAPLLTSGLTWDYLWSLHNEHRFPLPHLIQYSLYAASGDIRSGMWFSLALLALVAAASIAVARAVRGRTSWTDAAFPLAWLSTGNCENLLMGFQLSLMLPTALVVAILLIGVVHGRPLSRLGAVGAGLALLALPMCGGPGMLQAPFLALWLFAAGLDGWRTRERRAVARIAWAFVALTLAAMIAYLIGFNPPDTTEPPPDTAAVADVALRVMALGIGPAAEAWWPGSGVGALLSALAAVVLALPRVRDPGDRLRARTIVLVVGASACVAIGIGLGRSSALLQGGFPLRYIGLTTPAIGAAYFAWMLFGPARLEHLARASIATALALAFVPVGWRLAESYGTHRRAVASAFERDLAADVPAEKILWVYSPTFDPDLYRFTMHYEIFAQQGLPPFDRASEARRASFAELSKTPPHAHIERQHAGWPPPEGETSGAWLEPGGAMFFVVPPSATRCAFRYAPPPAAETARLREGCLRYTATSTSYDAKKTRVTAFDRVIESSDAGGIAAFELPPRCGQVEVRIAAVDGRPALAAGWWSTAVFE